MGIIPLSGAKFPRAAARLYLSGAAPGPPGLAGQPDPPSTKKIAAATARLRQAAASSKKSERQRALAAFVLGKGEAERGETGAAAKDLEAAARWTPVRDAATAELVSMWAQQHDPSRTLAAAERYPVATGDVFVAAIGKPAARAAVQLEHWKQALAWSGRFPHDPEMLWLRAQAEDGLGHARSTALVERSLVYEYPASAWARKAEAAWKRRERAMPKLAAGWKLTAQQAAAWASAGQYHKAADTWTRVVRMAPRKNRARLEAEETRAWLHAGHLITTHTRLRGLLRSSERAQALELEVELARRRGQTNAIAAPLAALAKQFPHSRWYARALHEAGNAAVLHYDDATTQARFDMLSRKFPRSTYAAKARWRATWIAFRAGQKDAPARLEKYLEKYPHGPAAVDAIYWRGVWAQQHHDGALARQCFQTAAQHFPGTFFGQQAALRTPVKAAATTGAAPAWLAPYRRGLASPAAAAIPQQFQAEVQRAEWMRGAGLLDPAAAILGHVLYRLPAAGSLAVARLLGTVDAERGAWSQGVAAMIRAVPHYLELQPDQLSAADWKQLFPAPFDDDIAAAAQHFGLDPYLLLGLIRQESGFNPGAVSAARARGLMQLELGTARARVRRLPTAWRRLKGPGRLSAQDLLKPGLNLALGASELQRLLGTFDQPAYALAGYNAGSRRVQEWQAQFSGLTLDAFIESVPFSQTRGYIQAVLRNAAHYRQIYADAPVQ